MKLFITILIAFVAFTQTAFCQANNDINKGNEAYHKGDFAAAIESYKNALRKEPENNTARFNLAIAMQRNNDIDSAKKNYDEVIQHADLNSMRAASEYNKGLAFVQEKDLQHAIAAFEESLKQNPDDDDARENLQKAMNELKKQQEHQNQQNKKQQQPQNQQNNKKQPPINKDMMEQKFNELRNQEKELQKKLQSKSNSGQPDKDW